MNTAENNSFNLLGHLWLKRGEKNFIGPGRIALLENIMTYGSISQAAKSMKMSYKAAWDAVDAMNSLSPQPLVQRVSGGKGGGGTVVTAYAKELITTYKDIAALHEKHLASLEDAFHDVLIDRREAPFSFSRLQGTVCGIAVSDRQAEISLLICGKYRITAQSTHAFTKLHALELHDTVDMLIESNNITLSKEPQKQLSSRNSLTGSVSEITTDGNDVLVSLYVCEETTLLARITSGSLNRLSIETGDTITAIFKAYNVTLLGKKGDIA